MTTYVKLTREMVDAFLSINKQNRKLNKNKLEQYKRDIRNGNFSTVCYTSKILVNSSHTKLLDGQTRLTAIKECGYPEFLMDIQEVPDSIQNEVMEHIDQGMVRKIGHIIEIKGESFPDQQHVIAIASSFIRTTARGNEAKKVEYADFDRTYKKFGGLIREISSLDGLKYCDRAKCNAPHLCGLLHALLIRPQDKEVILERWKCIRMGELVFRSAKCVRSIIKERQSGGFTKIEKELCATICKGLLNPDLGLLKLAQTDLDKWLYHGE